MWYILLQGLRLSRLANGAYDRLQANAILRIEVTQLEGEKCVTLSSLGNRNSFSRAAVFCVCVCYGIDKLISINYTTGSVKSYKRKRYD